MTDRHSGTAEAESHPCNCHIPSVVSSQVGRHRRKKRGDVDQDEMDRRVDDADANNSVEARVAALERQLAEVNAALAEILAELREDAESR